MLKDIIAPYASSFAPNMHTELRAQINKSRKAVLLSGNLVTNTRQEGSGVSARVYKNGIYGFSSMAEISDEAVKAVLNAAADNAEFLDKHASLNKRALPAIEKGSFFVENDISDIEQKAYIDYIKGVDSYIQTKYPNLAGRTIIATADSMEKILYTSDGCSTHSIMPRSYVYIFLTVEGKNGAPLELFEVVGGGDTFDKNFTGYSEVYSKIDKLYEKLMYKREGVYPTAGLKTCILTGELSGMLAHEAVGHTVEADLVMAGSVAAHNMNKRVASDLVSLTDFANTAFGQRCPLPMYVDDEGTPCEDAKIIENGILVGYMNNRSSAMHYGVKPQGNARAYEFSDEPLIRMRNTAIHPGTSKLEDMIASVDDGYLLTNTGNGQADTTGEFMFGVNMGYEIKNGKLGRAILDTTISGIAFETLQTVDMISDTVSWSSSGFCGKKQLMPVSLGGPAMRLKIMIGGR
ncbi:MAG: TldD/PmbA family protein [Acutalibacteraceae bacterium]